MEHDSVPALLGRLGLPGKRKRNAGAAGAAGLHCSSGGGGVGGDGGDGDGAPDPDAFRLHKRQIMEVRAACGSSDGHGQAGPGGGRAAGGAAAAAHPQQLCARPRATQQPRPTRAPPLQHPRQVVSHGLSSMLNLGGSPPPPAAAAPHNAPDRAGRGRDSPAAAPISGHHPQQQHHHYHQQQQQPAPGQAALAPGLPAALLWPPRRAPPLAPAAAPAPGPPPVGGVVGGAPAPMDADDPWLECGLDIVEQQPPLALSPQRQPRPQPPRQQQAEPRAQGAAVARPPTPLGRPRAHAPPGSCAADGSRRPAPVGTRSPDAATAAGGGGRQDLRKATLLRTLLCRTEELLKHSPRWPGGSRGGGSTPGSGGSTPGSGSGSGMPGSGGALAQLPHQPRPLFEGGAPTAAMGAASQAPPGAAAQPGSQGDARQLAWLPRPLRHLSTQRSLFQQQQQQQQSANEAAAAAAAALPAAELECMRASAPSQGCTHDDADCSAAPARTPSGSWPRGEGAGGAGWWRLGTGVPRRS
jgi:hypothetical protein